MSKYHINGMSVDEYIDKKTTNLLRASVVMCVISFATGLIIGVFVNCRI